MVADLDPRDLPPGPQVNSGIARTTTPLKRERSHLYNTSTLLTLTAGVMICCIAIYVVNLMWALFVLDPTAMGGYLSMSLGYGDQFVLARFVASAATVGGALVSAWSRTKRSARPHTPSAKRNPATDSRANGSRATVVRASREPMTALAQSIISRGRGIPATVGVRDFSR